VQMPHPYLQISAFRCKIGSLEMKINVGDHFPG
jgi:hypothetical protein